MTMNRYELCTAISQVMYRYARAVDRMDAELMLSCFRPDAHIRYGGRFEGDPQDFVEWIWPLHAAMETHAHLVSNVLVEERTDGIDSESYVLVTLRMTGPEGQFDYLTRGRYLDRWELDGDGVRIVDRLYVSDFRTTISVGGHDTEKFLPSNSVPLVHRSRDRHDASYARLAGS